MIGEGGVGGSEPLEPPGYAPDKGPAVIFSQIFGMVIGEQIECSLVVGLCLL